MQMRRSWQTGYPARLPLYLLLTVVCISAILAGKAADDFRVREHIGRDWRHECVTFPLSPEQLKQARAGVALAGVNGKPVAYQVVPAVEEQTALLAFHTDLPPYSTAIYSFTNVKADVKTDLTIKETAATLEIVNQYTGIRIRKKLDNGQGPIERMRLQSGAWVGDSRLTSDLPLTGYTVELTARGPVFAEIVCMVKLGDASNWEMRLRLNAGEPAVLVDENSAVAGNATTFQLDLQRDFAPNNIFHRRSWQDGFVFKLLPIQTGKVFVLEPWQNWYQSQTQGACFSLCTVDKSELNPEGRQMMDDAVIGSDMLSVAAREAGVWVNPDLTRDTPQALPRGVLTKDDAGLHLDFAMKHGQRKWMISALTTAQGLKKEGGKYPVAPPPFQYLVKHGQFPLDRVKDYVLSWDDSRTQYPHLLFTRADMEQYRARLGETGISDKLRAIPGLLNAQVSQYIPAGLIEAWIATGDERLARRIIDVAEYNMQVALENFLVQPVPYGSAPHMSPMPVINDAMTLTDAALATGFATPEQRQRLLAKAAFIAYAIDRPDFWSPARGYSGNPNMTSFVNGYLNSTACLVGSHPRAKAWTKTALDELVNNELHTWSDDGGGWLEAPHYAMASYDAILGALIKAHNAGTSDALFTDPKVKVVINWHSQIASPPDTRINNLRHRPPIGNTYMYEASGEFGILAHLFREKDPEFSAQMQWMYRQQGSFDMPGIGGRFPAGITNRTLLVDPALPAKAPAWKSVWFPRTGVMLRNGFPDPRETQLYMIAGSNHDHYDYDSGSITLWGKGRIVADDFGYSGRTPMNDHNMVESPLTGGVMQVRQFTTFDAFDYVDGLAGGWRRQIAFLKDADLLGPNYFIICDSFTKPTTATWRLWLTATDVKLMGTSAEMIAPRTPIDLGKENADLLEDVRAAEFTPSKKQTPYAVAAGKDDVDTEIFFTQPGGLILQTETKTRPVGSALFPDMHTGPSSTTQIGLIAAVNDCMAFTAVIYPRMKTDKAPVFTAIADGRGVKVQHAAGTDYVFVSPTPVVFREDGVSFEGTVGAVMLRGKRTVLSLGAAGNIAARGHMLTGETAQTQELTAR